MPAQFPGPDQLPCAQGHNNKGYLILPPCRQSDYRIENFPNSAQTQVTGLNDIAMNFHKVVFPTSNKSNPPVDQLLGINKFGEAIGFYVDAKGNSHGYLNNFLTHKFITIPLPGAVSVTGTGINSKNAVVRFFGVNDNGEVVGAYTIGTKSFGFTSTVRQHFRTFSDPHAIGTTVVNGVNNAGDLVGFFNSSNGRMHGMLAKP